MAQARRDRRGGPAFDLQLLGRPRVAFVRLGNDAVPVAWRLNRSFELVAFLALAPERWASRQRLVSALWGSEARVGAAERNFLPTISDARRSLMQAADVRSAPLLRDQGGYRLARSVRWQLDVTRLETEAETVERLRSSHPRRAFDLGRRAWRRYRGPLLAGIDRPWVEAPRDAVAHRYRRLLGSVAEVAVALDRLEDAVDAYRTLMIDDPYDEAVHLALMEIYARQRRPDLVRRQFMRLEDYLDELDVVPTDGARDRYRVLVSSRPDDTLRRDTMPAP